MSDQPSTADTLTTYLAELMSGGFAYDEATVIARDTARIMVEHDGLTVRAEAALADAGAWVEVETVNGLPDGARMRNNWRQGDPADDRTYVHRDDLPTDSDAELVEAIAFALYREASGQDYPRMSSASDRDHYLPKARVALAVVREHEAKS